MRYITTIFAIALVFLTAIPDSEANYGDSFLERQMQAMENSISHYRTLAKQGGWPEFPSGRKIEPSATDKRIPLLRQILTLTGDFSGDTASETYDEPLIAAVQRFQDRHGLEADGVVGGNTVKEINVPAYERLAQLEVNADRLRTHLMQERSQALDDRAIIVNIPAFELYALTQGKLDRQMRVIVGQPHNRTPVMNKEITSVHFNPAWNVPSRIAANEMLPKIKNDPDYLRRSGYSLISGGESVDPQAIDWETVDRSNFDFRIRQRPGSGNALGKVKFFLPDSSAIYLHDTASPKLFARTYRALSHGCIRVEDPKSLTQFVLQREADITPEQVDTMYDSSRSRSVSVSEPVPVSIVYWTAWADESGQPHFYSDIYRKDTSLIAEKLKAMDAVQMAAN